MHLSKGRLLVKRFKALMGKTPIPKFKSKVSEEAHILCFGIDEEVTVEMVQEIIKSFYICLDTDLLIEYQFLNDADKYLYILDNIPEAVDHCKKFFRK